MDTSSAKPHFTPAKPSASPGISPVAPVPLDQMPDQPVPPQPQPPTPPSKPAASPAKATSVAEDDDPNQPRVYAPLDIACCHQNVDLTNCGAAAGEPCHWQQPGMAGTYHAERIADAAAASHGPGTKPTVEDFDKAAWDTGLF